MYIHEIKEAFAQLGVKYVYLWIPLNDNLQTQEDKVRFTVYQKMEKFLDKLNVKPCRYFYMEKGKEIIKIVKENPSIDFSEVINDLKRIFKLLGGKQGK